MAEDDSNAPFDTFQQYRDRIHPTLSGNELHEQVVKNSHIKNTNHEGRAGLIDSEAITSKLSMVQGMEEKIAETIRMASLSQSLSEEQKAIYRTVTGKEPSE
jgi:hypothetical protein